MTINIPIETYKRYLEAVRILKRIVETASHPGIMAKDLDAAKKILEELRRS